MMDNMILIEKSNETSGELLLETQTYSTTYTYGEENEEILLKRLDSILGSRTITTWAVKLENSATWIAPFKGAESAIAFYGIKL